MVSSAGFLLDFSGAVNLPRGAVRLSRDVLEVEAPHMDELLAASVAGIPWRHEFPNGCMRCGKPGSWRSVLQAPQHAPLEVTWRYQRPENAVPLCHHCAETLNFLRDETSADRSGLGFVGATLRSLVELAQGTGRRAPARLGYQLPSFVAKRIRG